MLVRKVVVGLGPARSKPSPALLPMGLTFLVWATIDPVPLFKLNARPQNPPLQES